MAFADLHVHSRYSEHPTDWFLKRIGAKESYTEPETIYQHARERGMDFVTITDHNRIEGALRLCGSHPEDTFSGVELTTYFPEDGCKIHLLVFGLDGCQFDEMQRLRPDIYQLRHYVHEQGLAHSVAHATYPVNGKLSVEHLEKLILMFDVFEGINGGRNRANNETWSRVLSALDERVISSLREKHGLIPFGPTPWIKSFTGGSDDHAGLFVGHTCTSAPASSPTDFLEAIRKGGVAPRGRSNTYQALAFTVYKIAYDFSKQRREGSARGLLGALTELVFEKREFKLKEKLFIRRLSGSNGSRARIYQHLNNLIMESSKNSRNPIEQRLAIVYARLADLSDEFMRSLVNSIKRDIAEGDLLGFASSSAASIPGIFLSMPFFSAVREMFSNRALLDVISMRFTPDHERTRSRRILWFTDTFTDLNGVSVTLEKVADLARTADPGVRIVTALSEEEAGKTGENVVILPHIESFSLPGYEKYTLRVPSVLKSLEMIAAFEPDEIYISTPGPVGLTGLLFARLIGARVTGFFHTDYSGQAASIVADETITDLIENFIRWVFSCCDEIRVPTAEYIDLLQRRGYPRDKLVMFKRGIDITEFAPRDEPRQVLAGRFGLDSERLLVYTGRISREKNLDVALEAYRRVLRSFPGTGFVLAGDGPCMEELASKAGDLPGVRFLGRVPNKALPELYTLADLFVFPSDTDTFGMSVLEAQACGLPAVVSSEGGPREIVIDGLTGFIATAGDVSDWSAKICRVLTMIGNDVESYRRMRREARLRVVYRYDWRYNYQSLFTPQNRTIGACGAEVPDLADS